MSDPPPPEPPATNIHAIPTPERDRTAAIWAEMARTWGFMRDRAPEIAKTRKTMFDAYVTAGFNEVQALDLCKSLAL